MEDDDRPSAVREPRILACGTRPERKHAALRTVPTAVGQGGPALVTQRHDSLWFRDGVGCLWDSLRRQAPPFGESIGQADGGPSQVHAVGGVITRAGTERAFDPIDRVDGANWLDRQRRTGLRVIGVPGHRTRDRGTGSITLFGTGGARPAAWTGTARAGGVRATTVETPPLPEGAPYACVTLMTPVSKSIVKMLAQGMRMSSLFSNGPTTLPSPPGGSR